MSNIAGAINAAHEAVETAKRQVAASARECGRLLAEAKETVAHGGWDAWVQEHCRFSMRTAQLYMRIYRETKDDDAKAQRVADLSIREIARELATPRAPQQSEELSSKGEAEDRLADFMLEHLPAEALDRACIALRRAGHGGVAAAIYERR